MNTLLLLILFHIVCLHKELQKSSSNRYEALIEHYESIIKTQELKNVEHITTLEQAVMFLIWIILIGIAIIFMRKKLPFHTKKKSEEPHEKETNRLESSYETMQKESAIIDFLQKAADKNKEINDSDWTLLEQSINDIYPHFCKELFRRYPRISAIELRICYLIKINIAVRDIARLLYRSPSAISQSRKMLYQKIFHESGTPEQFDKFIKSL